MWRLTVNSVKETEDRNQFIEMRHNKIRRKHKRNTRGTAEKDMSVTMRDRGICNANKFMENSLL